MGPEVRIRPVFLFRNRGVAGFLTLLTLVLVDPRMRRLVRASRVKHHRTLERMLGCGRREWVSEGPLGSWIGRRLQFVHCDLLLYLFPKLLRANPGGTVRVELDVAVEILQQRGIIFLPKVDVG